MSTSNGSAGVPRLLAKAPLARVLVQIRWPELANYNLDEVSAAMGRRLGDLYPLVSRNAEAQVTFTPAGLIQQENGYITRFSSADEAWTVSVGKSFLALDTSMYDGHANFLERLRVVCAALSESALIPFVNRVGYRYTNRVVGVPDLASLATRFKPSVLGGLGAAPDDSALVHSITEAVYRTSDSFLLVRSAQVGPNEAIDPTLPPVAETSWILDLDAYDESRHSADPVKIVERCEALSRLASRQFHSVVTDDFYERYA